MPLLRSGNWTSAISIVNTPQKSTITPTTLSIDYRPLPHTADILIQLNIMFNFQKNSNWSDSFFNKKYIGKASVTISNSLFHFNDLFILLRLNPIMTILMISVLIYLSLKFFIRNFSNYLFTRDSLLGNYTLFCILKMILFILYDLLRAVLRI